MTNPRLDQWLDALDRARTAPATEPPGAFIHAVARRRFRRRLAAASQGAVALAALAFIVVMLRPTPHTAHAPNRPLTQADPDRIAASLPDSSMIALTRANLSRDPDHLILPDTRPAAAAPASHAGTPVSVLWSTDQVERWLDSDSPPPLSSPPPNRR